MLNKVAFWPLYFFQQFGGKGQDMRILMIGDIVGQVGRQTIATYLSQLKKTYSPDLVVVNGENAAANGRGITKEIVRELTHLGVDCITLGNHTWAQPEIFDFIDDENRLIRPANFPEGTPGRGFMTIPTSKGKCTIINLMGRTYSFAALDCPFRAAESILSQLSDNHYIIVDFHAETTSEKQALAWFLDGKVSAVIGTHTHVQTADERILPRGTAYLTDMGMVGAYDSVLGMETEGVLKRFITQLPVRFEVSKSGFVLQGVLLDFDPTTKMATKLKRIRIDNDHPWLN
jgi:2',3'-cyclic-nucleotide 2'-phosphodiesterase